MKSLFIAVILSCTLKMEAYSQQERKKVFPSSAIALQYAGSTGLASVGYFRVTENEKIQLGLLYGFTPERAGGNLHSLSLKFIYDPYKIHLSKRFYVRPLQTGVFISQSFGKQLDFQWPDHYPRHYYRWAPSLRFHIHLGLEMALLTNKSEWLDHVSFYFESNTNDLYIGSYFGNNNYRALSLYDIVFFGVGSKCYLKHRGNETREISK